MGFQSASDIRSACGRVAGGWGGGCEPVCVGGGRVDRSRPFLKQYVILRSARKPKTQHCVVYGRWVVF